jgi:DNA-binding MarR family transcriptional regulator
MPGMEAGQLHQLGKCLIQLSEATTSSGDITLQPGEAAVLEDVIEHPDSSISTIHERTGFAQTHVSESVVRLKKHGLLATAGDRVPPGLASAWRSGTRVRPTAKGSKTISRRETRRVDEAVARAVADPSQAARAIDLMNELASILL